MKRTGRMLVLLLLTASLGLLAGCGGSGTADTESSKLLIVGIDSADWTLLRPMVDEGRMPRLQKLMGESAHGRMKTFYPLEKSPPGTHE